MRTRRVWRPPWYAWALIGIVGLGIAYKVFPERFQGSALLIMPLLIALGAYAVRRLWDAPPAVPLCGAIILTIFSDGWSYLGLGGMPLNRLLVVVVLLQFALRAPGIAHVPRVQVRNVHILMAFTVIYALVSATASGTLTTSEGILSLTDVFGVVPFLLFLLAPAIFAGERERNLLLATFVGLGLYLGVTAIFEALGPRSFVFPSYVIHTDLAESGVVEVSGPFQSPVAEGFAVYACAVASLIAFTRWRGWRRKYLAAFVGVTCMFACFATLERGVWIAAGVATVAAALATRKGRRWLVPGALVCVIGLGAVLTLSSQLSQRTSERANYERSVWDRENQNAAGLRMVAARPLFGFGWGRFESDSLPYFRLPATYPMVGSVGGVAIGQPQQVPPLHNTHLSYAVELGIVGWLLWLLCLITAIVSAVQRPGPADLAPWKLGLIAIATFFLIVSFFDPHEQPFPMLLLLVWAGVAYGSAPLHERGPRQQRQIAPPHGVAPVAGM